MINYGIIYLTYNSEQAVLACLPRLLLFASQPPPIIAIDNASTDNTVEVLQHFGLNPIVNPENVGYTRGINQGLKQAIELGWDWAVLANPDVGVLYEWDKNLFKWIDDSIGIMGVRLTYNNKPNHCGGVIEKYYLPLRAMVVEPIVGDISVVAQAAYGSTRLRHGISERALKQIQPVPWVTFAFVVLNLKMVQKIGLLDERFFLYNSDSEYCLRAWAKGWTVFYNPVTFHHYMGKSSEGPRDWLLEVARKDGMLFAEIEEHLISEAEEKWV